MIIKRYFSIDIIQMSCSDTSEQVAAKVTKASSNRLDLSL